MRELIELELGSRVLLSDNKYRVYIDYQSESGFDLDEYFMMLNHKGKLVADEGLVFFNNYKSKDDVIQMIDESIFPYRYATIDFSKASSEVKEIAVYCMSFVDCESLTKETSIAQVDNLELFVQSENNDELYHYRTSQLDGQSILLASIERYNEKWFLEIKSICNIHATSLIETMLPSYTESNIILSHLKSGDILFDVNSNKMSVNRFLINRCYGELYEVTYNGNGEKLIWYHSKLDDLEDNGQYIWLTKMIENGPPSRGWIWPEALTKKYGSSYGYIEPLLPKNSEHLSFYSFRRNTNSGRLLCKCCINLAHVFSDVHDAGLCFKNIDVPDFFFAPNTGELLIHGFENIALQNSTTDYAVAIRIASPEMVEGDRHVNKYTDLFSLSIMFYELLMGAHPFEGEKALSNPALTQEIVKNIYGKKAVFVFDPYDDSNRPAKIGGAIMSRRWEILPNKIKEAFVKAFSRELIIHPDMRITESEWISLFEEFC